MSRINDILETIGSPGRTPEGAITRLGNSPEYRQAVDAAKAYMDALGMQTRVDSVGNLHGVLPGSDPTLKSIVLGSHLDTVIQGGLFDGALGVAGAIEAVSRLKEQNITLAHTLEIWGFNFEEASPLGGTFGSRAIAGLIDPDAPQVAPHLTNAGFTREDVLAAKQDLSRYRCYLELHIEQGGRLEQEKLSIGVVNGIVGIVRYKVTAHGAANHGGTTMMPNRRDALVGMSKLIVASDALARELDDTLVLTVGKIAVSPGQESVIPGECVATFEMRHMKKDVMETFYQGICARANDIPDAVFTFDNTVAKYSAPCDPGLITLIDGVCADMGVSHVIMPSGASHDANPIGYAGVPMGMIFVPSHDGISHSGKEWTAPEDVACGADVLFQTLLKLDSQRP